MAVKNSILSYSLNRCKADITETVIRLLREGKSFKEIEETLNFSAYDLSDYIVAAFQASDVAPSGYVSVEDYNAIMKVLEELACTTRRNIKEELKNSTGKDFEYEPINVCLGIYFRTKHFYNKKDVVDNKIVKKEVEVEQLSVASVTNGSEKIELQSIPMFNLAIQTLKTEHWRKFAIELFTKYCPKQFFVMPATMGKFAHDIVELSYGAYSETEPNKIVRIGGKAFHTIRVYENICTLLEPDSPEIKDFSGKVKTYIYGNEYADWEADMLKVAALAHDIYSGGTGDDFDFTRKKLDVDHPYYHRTELAPISNILPENEWNDFLVCIENHMWKWSPKPTTICFNDGKKAEDKDAFYSLYRKVKDLETADYIAAQRDKTRGKEILFSINAYAKLFGTYDISDEDLAKLNITSEELIKAFGHDDLKEIVRICQKIK